ncbi:hypothetical protein [Timonella senegalensis]|uniref:hypothetical protein n=1 Tax=Timonella senegalensis TaxID=1465825 RepID=UPI00058B18B6|nr:hypothetical protein [Timonella senegalensis]
MRPASAFGMAVVISGVTLLSGCSSAPSCGDGYEEPAEAILMLVTAARMDAPEWACASLPKGSSKEQVASEVASYSDFAALSDSTRAEEVDQMGRSHLLKVTVGDQSREVEVVSQSVGRWFWRKDVYHVVPTTYELESGSTPSPSTTVD